MREAKERQNPENLQIPENWNFPERGDPHLGVVQIDLDERFLALRLPDDKEERYEYRERYGDYFFDSDGNLLQHRTHYSLDTIILLTGDSTVLYSISDVARKGLSIYLLPSPPTEEDLMPPNLGGFEYCNGHLDRVSLGDTFITDRDQGGIIESPRLYFDMRYEKWRSSVFGANKEEIFRIKWSEEVSEVGAEKIKATFLVVSQTHVPTKIEKILKAPLRIDRQKYIDAVFAKPPYGKERVAGQDRLVVPWRSIDRLVGASLSYSYPPDQSQKLR